MASIAMNPHQAYRAFVMRDTQGVTAPRVLQVILGRQTASLAQVPARIVQAIFQVLVAHAAPPSVGLTVSILMLPLVVAMAT